MQGPHQSTMLEAFVTRNNTIYAIIQPHTFSGPTLKFSQFCSYTCIFISPGGVRSYS